MIRIEKQRKFGKGKEKREIKTKKIEIEEEEKLAGKEGG